MVKCRKASMNEFQYFFSHFALSATFIHPWHAGERRRQIFHLLQTCTILYFHLRFLIYRNITQMTRVRILLPPTDWFDTKKTCFNFARAQKKKVTKKSRSMDIQTYLLCMNDFWYAVLKVKFSGTWRNKKKKELKKRPTVTFFKAGPVWRWW